MVLARTRAEARALSHLMRERRSLRYRMENGPMGPDRVTVMVSRGTEDERSTSPLEIARWDRLRIGATHWVKQLFNGTVVTVEDFKVEKRGEAGSEPSVLISARTEDGREVRFRHDEIRDWYGNIRLDHGYAMTITSAQGLTVDRTFLLADARPSRETIYPAATRHREMTGHLRQPGAARPRHRRPAGRHSDLEVAVTDTEIREPTWRNAGRARSRRKQHSTTWPMVYGKTTGTVSGRTEADSSGEVQDEAGEVRVVANDNTLARIARDVRRTAFGWRHARTVAAFADGRRQVLTAYDDLRERTRIARRCRGAWACLPGDAHTPCGALLKQAETFRARPDEFASLLAERGGIARKDLDEFQDLHARARRHWRAATMRHVHRIGREAEQEAQQPKPGLRQGELALEGSRAEAPRRSDTVTPDTTGKLSPERDATPAQFADDIPPVEAEDYPWVFAVAAQKDVTLDQDPPRPDWLTPYEALQRDWNEVTERVRQTGEPLFYAQGYADIIPRIQALAENPDIPAETRAPMIEALENHQRDLSARQYVEDYLDAVERHMETHASLQRIADGLGVRIVQVSDHLGWRQEADRLTATAETILGDGERYGRPSRQYGNRSGRAWKRGTYRGCATSSGRMANMPLQSQETGTAQRTCGYAGEQSNNRKPADAGLDASLRSLAAGLEQPHRRRPASRYPIILRQGLHGHRHARSKDCGDTRISRPNHGHP